MAFLKNSKLVEGPIPILNKEISITEYCPIDFSITNEELKGFNITNAEECQQYIDGVLKRQNAKVAYGGYLEQRNLYGTSARFQGEQPRNIHLGMDFWCASGTSVMAPLDGKVHSFANNSDDGNYGPTIILEHQNPVSTFYTLYGHLSLESIVGLNPGQYITKGDAFAFLGAPEINVGYAPHLHFQLIIDMGKYQGDYPGVCSSNEILYYSKNCPNPNLLLGYDA